MITAMRVLQPCVTRFVACCAFLMALHPRISITVAIRESTTIAVPVLFIRLIMCCTLPSNPTLQREPQKRGPLSYTLAPLCANLSNHFI